MKSASSSPIDMDDLQVYNQTTVDQKQNFYILTSWSSNLVINTDLSYRKTGFDVTDFFSVAAWSLLFQRHINVQC